MIKKTNILFKSSSNSKFGSDDKGSIDAFTIVELLIVIVIIGILAAITIVSYTGITKKAGESSVQAELSNASKKLSIYYTLNGTYPTSIDQSSGCPTAPVADTQNCIKFGSGTTFSYKYKTASTYGLSATKGPSGYLITESSSPVAFAPSFVKAWGGTNSENSYDVAQTNDGGYAITGNTRSFGAGGNDMLLSKFDASGNLSWNKTWGGTGHDYGYGVIQTSDGGYIVTGNTGSYGAGSNDIFLAKYDASGNLSWNKTWGGASVEYNYGGVIQTSDGGYAITGQTASYGAGDFDILLSKFDASGNLIWNRLLGGTGYEYSQDLIQTNDGGYAVIGYTSSYGAGGYDMFLAKYDASGNLSWNKTWGGTGHEYGYGVIQNSDGGYVITGQTASYGAGSNDMFLAKYDASGNLSWNKTWGGASTEYGQSLTKTSDGGYAVTGNTGSYGAGSNDTFLAKYDASGNLSWNKTWGSTNVDMGQSLTQTSDGGYVVAGYTQSNGYDALLVKYDASGNINSCPSSMCATPTATITTPAATVTAPTLTVTNPAATITTPTATVTTPTATVTTIVAP